RAAVASVVQGVGARAPGHRQEASGHVASGDARPVQPPGRGAAAVHRSQRVTVGIVAGGWFVRPLFSFLPPQFHYSHFPVYYIACRDALGLSADLGGRMPPFRMQHTVFVVPRVDGGFVVYRYTPFFLCLLTPLALLPYPLACILFAALNALAIAG